MLFGRRLTRTFTSKAVERSRNRKHDGPESNSECPGEKRLIDSLAGARSPSNFRSRASRSCARVQGGKRQRDAQRSANNGASRIVDEFRDDTAEESSAH